MDHFTKGISLVSIALFIPADHTEPLPTPYGYCKTALFVKCVEILRMKGDVDVPNIYLIKQARRWRVLKRIGVNMQKNPFNAKGI